jgi:hypothetical protein
MFLQSRTPLGRQQVVCELCGRITTHNSPREADHWKRAHLNHLHTNKETPS